MNKYIRENYDTLIKQSYAHDQKQYDSVEGFAILKSLYERNYLNKDGERKIPKKIHQIWIGGELPHEYRRFTESWSKFHPD